MRGTASLSVGSTWGHWRTQLVLGRALLDRPVFSEIALLQLVLVLQDVLLGVHAPLPAPRGLGCGTELN